MERLLQEARAIRSIRHDSMGVVVSMLISVEHEINWLADSSSYRCEIKVPMNSNVYSIVVEQNSKRTVTIEVVGDGCYDELLKMYYEFKRLLMIFDGCFTNIASAKDISADITHSIKKRNLPSYNTASYILKECIGLTNYQGLLDQELFSKWLDIETQLGLVHQMYLYCLSDADIPIDLKCAFMIELFRGVAELVEKKDSTFKLRRNQNGHVHLKDVLSSLIGKYGNSIFYEEMKHSCQFIQILVDSRNRIAHLAYKKEYLNGPQCEIYIMKLSMLYRKILLELMGIPKQLINKDMKKSIKKINSRAVTINFVKGL